MRKRISLLNVRTTTPDPEWLGVRLIERRLTRQRRAIEHSQAAGDWLDMAVAMWRMRQNDGHDAIDGLVDMPTIGDYPHYPKRLAPSECARIMAWSKNWVSRMSTGHPLPAKLSKEDGELLTTASQGMKAVYLTDHEIDQAFSRVHDQFPWLAALTEKAWRQALRRAKSGLPAGVGAMLLSGSPGLGKSSWARVVARELNVPSLQIDVGATGGTFDLQGVSRGWGSSDKGRVVSTILHERVGNPLVVLDEIDAGSASVGTTRGSVPGLYKTLMGMIEPSTAGAWTCPYYQAPFDLRHISWVCTANSTAHIEQALLDRLVIVEIPDMTRQQLLDFARREAVERFDGEHVEMIVQQIDESVKRGNRPSLRQITRLLDRTQDAIDRPVLH